MKSSLAIAALALSLVAARAAAVGTLVPVTAAHDMVYDAKRDLLYVTQGDHVLRYSVSGAAYLSPIVLGGKLQGIDLSPDGNTIAVGDDTSSGPASGPRMIWVHLVNADTLVDSKPSTIGYILGTGTYAVAYGANGTLAVTERSDGSFGDGSYLYSLASNGTWTNVGGGDLFISEDTPLSASGDAKTIAFVWPDESPVTWATYDTVTGVVAKHGIANTGSADWGLAVNTNGSQFVVPVNNIVPVFDRNATQLATLPLGPLGAAYHPVKPLVYIPWSGTNDVRVYDMTTFQLKTTYNFVNGFTEPLPVGPVVTRLSRDGSLLMVMVNGGVRIFRMYAPLAAAAVSAHTLPGQSVQITAAGSLGTTGTILYKLTSKPAHGQATLSGNIVTYKPVSGFTGTDTFNYQAQYGRAVVAAPMTVSVSTNQPPVAVNDSLTVHATTPLLVPVLANDSDPEGQTLSIIAVTQPSAGSVAIQGTQILYTPPAASDSTETLQYTISDGHGGTAKARATVRVTHGI